MCVFFVDSWVCSEFFCRECGVQIGNFGRFVGDVVEESVVGVIIEVVYYDIECDSVVWFREMIYFIIGYQFYVIEDNIIERIYGLRFGQCFFIVIDQLVCNVVV